MTRIPLIDAMTNTLTPTPTRTARIHGPRPRSWWYVVPTREGQAALAKRYRRLGYLYIVGGPDARGYWLHAVQFSEWGNTVPYVSL